MVTPRLLPLSILRLNGQMPKLYLPLWRMWWLKLNPSMGWWCGRVHRIAFQPSPLTPILSSSWCYLGRKSNGTSLRPCMWKQRDSGGRDLSYPIPWDISIRSDKEGQSVYGPSLAPMEDSWSLRRLSNPTGHCIRKEQSCP